MCDGPPRSFLDNWRHAEGSLVHRSTQALRNNLRKMVRLRGCCGNHGEPGC